MRRSTRIVRAVPMRVTGLDLLGSLSGTHCHVGGQQPRLPVSVQAEAQKELLGDPGSHRSPGDRLLHSVQARVVCVQRRRRGRDFSTSPWSWKFPEMSGVSRLPPGDWLPFRKPNPLRTSTTAQKPPKTARKPTASPASVSEAEHREGSPSLGERLAPHQLRP